MVILGVILTLIICLLVDWRLQRRGRTESTTAPEPSHPPRPLRLGPSAHAGGFQFHEEMAYHTGHAWAFVEGPRQVRVGIDDFARRLAGHIERISLPAPGDRLRQGEPAWTLHREGRRAPMLSPLSGQVVAVNARLLAEPGLVAQDPYCEGWLLVVRPSALRANLNNLLSGRLARRWLEDAAARLRARLHGAPGLSFPDGGTAVEDIGSLLADEAWEEAVQEFLLTDP